MTTFVILRHGETEWNVAGRLQGWRDSALTATGREQAERLAARLAGERIDAIVASDLGRARDTAAPIAARLGLAIADDWGLRERRYGVFEGSTWSEIAREDPPSYQRFNARDQDFVVPGGESGLQFRDRVVNTFERLAALHRGRRVAIVTHGGVLGIAYRFAYRIPLELPRTFAVPNAGVNRLRIDGRRWTIEVWGSVDHLPADALDDE